MPNTLTVSTVDEDVHPADEPRGRPRDRSGGNRRRWLIVAALVVLLAIAAGGAGYGAGSAAYSPQRAVLDYLAAQQAGDANRMLSDATFLRGDTAYAPLLDRQGLVAMMKMDANKSIRGAHVVSSRQVDAATVAVRVTMTWETTAVSREYTVTRDPSATHFLVFPAWKVQVPYSTTSLTLPPEAGRVSVDGIALPTGSNQQTIEVIQGFHVISTQATDLYDGEDKRVDARGANAAVLFSFSFDPAVVTAAADAVRKGFASCDPAASRDCLGHTYSAPNRPNEIYFFDIASYGRVDYKTYQWSLTSDPTATMKLEVEPRPGVTALKASGPCGLTLTVDGSRTIKFQGTFTADLVENGDTLEASVLDGCDEHVAQ